MYIQLQKKLELLRNLNLYDYSTRFGKVEKKNIYTDINFVDNFLQVVIYLALVANI